MKKIRMARDGYVLISIIFYIAGIVCMTIPSISPLVLCITGGIILVAYGIVKIIGYLSDDLYDLAFQYDLACGIFLIVLGVIVLGCNLRIRSYLSPAFMEKVSRSMITVWYTKGYFPVVKIRNHVRIKRKEFEAWLEKRNTERGC